MRWLIVGLGNPGSRYEETRHNAGFMIVDALAERGGGAWRRTDRFDGMLAQAELSGTSVWLLKPSTYMNLSGQSVGPAARFYRIPVEQIIVLHDDVDLALGRIRVKRGGGDGGHKGIRSVAEQLGSPDFVRVRFGVGRPVRGEVVDFVLGGFSKAEREATAEAVGRAADAAQTVIEDGVTAAMNRHNRPLPAASRSAGDR